MAVRLKSFSQGKWAEGTGTGAPIYHAVTGDQLFVASSEGVDFKGMLDYARKTGGTKLRKMTFHERARIDRKSVV